MNAPVNDIQAFLADWSAAERAGDTGRLAALLTDDFSAVGPMGFVLDKQAWLARYGDGGLSYDTFDVGEVRARVYGETAIVTARTDGRGAYQGHPVPEATRATLNLIRDAGRWRLAAIHMSFVAGTGAPSQQRATLS